MIYERIAMERNNEMIMGGCMSMMVITEKGKERRRDSVLVMTDNGDVNA